MVGSPLRASGYVNRLFRSAVNNRLFVWSFIFVYICELVRCCAVCCGGCGCAVCCGVMRCVGVAVLRHAIIPQW